MVDFKLIIKGMIIGLAKVIPGVSGSLIAVSLGIYGVAIEIISHPFKNIKYSHKNTTTYFYIIIIPHPS